MAESSYLRERLTSLSSESGSKKLDLQNIQGLVNEGVKLRKHLHGVRKETEKRSTKLALLKKVEDKIAVTKTEEASLVTSMIKAREQSLFSEALMCKRDVGMQLLRQREMALDP